MVVYVPLYYIVVHLLQCCIGGSHTSRLHYVSVTFVIHVLQCYIDGSRTSMSHGGSRISVVIYVLQSKSGDSRTLLLHLWFMYLIVTFVVHVLQCYICGSPT